MIKVEHFETYGWDAMVRGVRNPFDSWSRSDSFYDGDGDYILGENDLDLMRRLCKGGSDDRKFLRQISVSCDITAPLYWWKQADQYKVGTTTNSCSTMNRISEKEFTLDDFSHEHLDDDSALIVVIEALNKYREAYLEKKYKSDWWGMIQLLPSSYNQMRTWTGNYEVLRNMYHARKNHKLDEWHVLCYEIEKLPYAKELIIGE